jgi:1A family penicillin-binding protein
MARELPDPDQFVSRQINQSTKIYDRTGEILLYEIHGEEKRTIIPFEDIPDYVKEATIAIEDQGFYEHPAFDWRATLRAIIVNILKGRLAQGGSTITQQLARNAFLTPEKTFARKIKELILANWIEKRYTKDKILNLYLNQIPYGANAYGIEAAAQTYFGEPAESLSLAEAAALAALPRAPTYYSPWGPHKEELLQRKNYVLEQMFKAGYIDEEEKNRAQNEKLNFIDKSIGSIRAPHFVMLVRDYLINKYGEDMVEKGGLNVMTTLDWPLQELAERVAREGAERNADLYNGRNAALVAQDPKTGQVLAMVGSKSYSAPSEPAGCEAGKSCQFEGNFNVASQGLRQPGSAFKPFAYATAFKRGYTPDTVVFDLPTEFSTYVNACPLIGIDYFHDNPLCFHPENFDNRFRGPVNLRNALAQSINVPSVKVLYLAGIENSIKTARDFGITTLADPSRYGLSLVLGGGEVKLLDMVGAYSVFPQEGIRHKQSFILEIKAAGGEMLEKYTDEAAQVIEPQYALLINEILSDVEARSSLFQNSLNLTVFPDREVALKTGTTNDYRDAWAIGYTPSLVVGVWAGNNNNQPMQKQAGSILAAVPIWNAFLKEAFLKYPNEAFNKPESVSSDRPMLNGEYITNGEAHDILYYVNPANPSGPTPQNPGDNPQYLNWELPVELWLRTQNLAPIISSTSTTPL